MAAMLLAAAVVNLALPCGAHAAVVATTDFGTTDGTNISPFLTDYSPMNGPTQPDHYWVAKSGGGYSWSSFDWGGVDHTTGTGDFMVVDGAQDSDMRIVYYTTNVVAGETYTFHGYVQDIISGNWGPPVLSFRVDGSEIATFAFSNQRTWDEFTFTYNAPASGAATFAINDNNTNYGMNDFGLDDLTLSTTASAVPEPSSLLLLAPGLAGLAVIRRRLRK
jgi:hypothetical protein